MSAADALARRRAARERLLTPISDEEAAGLRLITREVGRGPRCARWPGCT